MSQVGKWLHSAGLGGLAEIFEASGVTYDLLLDVTNDDLRDLNIPLGDRIRFRNALKSLEQKAHSQDTQTKAQDPSDEWNAVDFIFEDISEPPPQDPWAKHSLEALNPDPLDEEEVEPIEAPQGLDTIEGSNSSGNYDHEPMSADELVAFLTDVGPLPQTARAQELRETPSTYNEPEPSPIDVEPAEVFDWWDDDASLVEYTDADDEPDSSEFDLELFEFDSGAAQKPWDNRVTHFDPKEAKAQEKAASVVSIMDIKSAKDREFAQDFLTEFFTTYSRFPTFRSVHALADQKNFSLLEFREVVLLRQVWSSTPKWWHIRRGGAVVTSRSFLGLSWPLTLDVCRSRGDFPPEEMIDDNWYDEWRSLKTGSKGYVSFGSYVKEKIKYDQYGFEVDGIDGEDRFGDFYISSQNGADYKRQRQKILTPISRHSPEPDFNSNELSSSPDADHLTPNQQYDLAVRFENGHGVEESMDQAAYWYMQAAPRGHAEAQCHLGLCYELGEGVEQDINKAIHWFSKASQQNLSEAHVCLALCLEKSDPHQALELFMRAAENGNSDAQFILGDRYSCGERQPRDLSKARKWYSMAAEQGDLEAKLKLANIDDEFRQSARPTYPNYNETPNDISAKPNKGFPLTIEFNSPAIRNGDLLEDIYISSIDGGIGKLASKYDRSGEHRFDIRPGVQFLDFDIYRRNHSVPNPEKFLGRFRISPCMTSHMGKSVSISVFFTMTDIKISLSPSSKLDDLKIARVY